MHYYNEFDPRAAAWLRELMKQKLIPEGKVDERDIRDIRGSDLDGFVQCHFFAGIGGWPLALRLAGWPEDEPVWTGSCPCQPFSVAGKKRGKRDPRHLWPEFKRLIGERKPAIVLGEQVASKAGRLWLAGVFADLEALAYAVAGADLCAAGVGAPHIRQRLFWVADADKSRGHEWSRSGQQSIRDENNVVSGSECIDGRLADDPRQRRNWRPTVQESSGRSFAENGGEAGGMAIAAGEQTESSNAQRFHAESGGGGDAGRLADSQEVGRGSQQPDGGRCVEGSGTQERSAGSAVRGAVGGMEHSNGSGLREQCGPQSVGASHPSLECSGAWSRFDIIPCRDGKARRIESGSFPLADGFPGRVGILRGYGNAIVPQLAAEFVAACRDLIS